MKNFEQIESEAAALVAELFADDKTPMESFGISWSDAEMLERRNPGVVIKLAPDDCRKIACY